MNKSKRGIEIEKVKETSDIKYNRVVRIKCGKLSFDECVGKLKSNLGTIAVDMGNDSSLQAVLS